MGFEKQRETLVMLWHPLVNCKEASFLPQIYSIIPTVGTFNIDPHNISDITNHEPPFSKTWMKL